MNAIIDNRVISETYKLIEKTLTQNNARKQSEKKIASKVKD